MLKKLTAVLLLATAFSVPGVAYAKDATLAIRMTGYQGPPAYLAVYLTKPDGSYDSTLWVAGTQSKYYRHLRGWIQGVSGSGERLDGITGASVGSGRTMEVGITIADALIDAGYTIHVDSAVEHGAENQDDVVLPLTSANSGTVVSGSGYISAMAVTF
ncbi:DUF2271 domain-containing protein [Devosia aquimaris]|uniref:DUF2271 domain-containing protein n=1 Tax=Devosia aquimaris TaxID=2866214 RepID=UPI001CD150CE|nr:DUF2271 domain-containing protein [Devosia sp. CJK-A8-3]